MRWRRHSGGNACCIRVRAHHGSCCHVPHIYRTRPSPQAIKYNPLSMNFIIRAILIDHPNVWGNFPPKESLKHEAFRIGLYREILAPPQGTASSAGVHLYRSRVSIEFLFLHFSWCLFMPPLGLQFQLRRKLLIYFIKMSWYAASTTTIRYASKYDTTRS